MKLIKMCFIKPVNHRRLQKFFFSLKIRDEKVFRSHKKRRNKQNEGARGGKETIARVVNNET